MGIGTLNEGPLHAALKDYYLRDGGQPEVAIGDFVADVVVGDKIYEIQTGSFSGLSRKFNALTQSHVVTLVHPISQVKTIRKVDSDGETVISSRRSPKRGALSDILSELVYIPALLLEENFSVEALLIEEDEFRIHDPKKARRRGGWRIYERRLVAVQDCLRIEKARDLYEFFFTPLSEPFTSKDIEVAMCCNSRVAGQMAYVLRHTNLIKVIGKSGRFIEYRFAD